MLSARSAGAADTSRDRISSILTYTDVRLAAAVEAVSAAHVGWFPWVCWVQDARGVMSDRPRVVGGVWQHPCSAQSSPP